MGVLEDAIREHLDLRRRHGAAEEELRHQEAEALGPARREDEVEPAAEPAAEVPEEAGEERTHLMEVPPPEDEPGMPFDGSDDETSWEADQGPRPEPVLEDEPFVTDEPLVAEPDPLPDPEPLPDEPPPREALLEDTVIAEPPLEDQPLAEEEEPPPREDEDEDVLEETPDFLSETPEHDRLWFEQKPPRDFDFD